VTISGPALTPHANVEIVRGRLVATSSEPWLSVGPHPALRPGDLVEITYRTSFWDEPVRPLFRFHLSTGAAVDRIAPGPVAGTAIFKTRIPKHTTAIGVSPTSRIGRFDFEITKVRRLSFLGELLRAAKWKPGEVRSAILTRLIGWADESDVNLTWASASTPIAFYDEWREARTRHIDLRTIDAPRWDWNAGPEIWLFLDAAAARPADLAATIDSLQTQAFPKWKLCLIAERDLDLRFDDPRIEKFTRSKIDDAFGAFGSRSFVGVVCAGTQLRPWALAVIAEAAARHEQARVFYGDEDFRSASGALVPLFKPAWSPLLEARRPYLGRASFLRADLVHGWSDDERRSFLAQSEVPASAAARFDESEVTALRRTLLTRPDPPLSRETRIEAAAPPIVHLPENPSAVIIIPTRDRARLLGRCIETIFEKTAFANFSIVIVDNESVEPPTKTLFDHFRGDKNVTIVRSPGPFNFSALSNAAAARRKCDVLVFLNNDTEIVSENWLGHLVEQALLPDVGAVSGLLLYPDRRIQHVGVVLGMGNSAGHFGAGEPEHAAGWLSRNEVVHEVSAVTGACLAVARRKFMLVGGFDAEHLPVELSDIDLCLRLAERGWRTRLDPRVRLVHAESASRGGATFRRLHVYAEQRRWLHERWLNVLRDDPYFHPGLSLYDRGEALG
jgi:GT2 family glycosyltransferase